MIARALGVSFVIAIGGFTCGAGLAAGAWPVALLGAATLALCAYGLVVGARVSSQRPAAGDIEARSGGALCSLCSALDESGVIVVHHMCGEIAPGADLVSCTRKLGHVGNHAACGSRPGEHPAAAWEPEDEKPIPPKPKHRPSYLHAVPPEGEDDAA